MEEVKEIDVEMVKELKAKLLEYKGEDVVAYQVNDKVDYTDYVVIVTANSSPHVRALYQLVHAFFKEKGIPPYHHHKRLEQSQWLVCDFFDLIVHILLPAERGFYKLENIFQGNDISIPSVDSSKKQS